MNAARLILTAALLITPSVAAVAPGYAGQVADNRKLLTAMNAVASKDSRFTPMYSECRSFQPPRLLSGRASVEGASLKRVLVDIIVLGTGRIDSPFIVEGGDASLEPQLKQLLSGWRYQPATCDGTPIDAEGRIHLKLENTASPKSELNKPLP